MPQLALFQTGSMQFALDRNCISHIEPLTTELKAAQGRVQKQTIVYKGRPLVLVDLATTVGTDAAVPYPAKVKMIVVKGTPDFALWADSIKGVLSVKADQMDVLPPVFACTARACFPKVLRLKDQLVLVVDTAALAKQEQISVISPSVQQQQPKQAAAGRGPSLVEEAALMNRLSARSDDHTIETIVAQKLKQFIGRRVKQVVALTMAETLERYRV